MRLSGKVFGNIIGYKKIFLGSVYIHKKRFSLPHHTFHVAYMPNFRPAEVTVKCQELRAEANFSKISPVPAVLSPSFFLWLLRLPNR